jgi:hypothetical protein
VEYSVASDCADYAIPTLHRVAVVTSPVRARTPSLVDFELYVCYDVLCKSLLCCDITSCFALSVLRDVARGVVLGMTPCSSVSRACTHAVLVHGDITAGVADMSKLHQSYRAYVNKSLTCILRIISM